MQQSPWPDQWNADPPGRCPVHFGTETADLRLANLGLLVGRPPVLDIVELGVARLRHDQLVNRGARLA